jgi:hypothetical protein
MAVTINQTPANWSPSDNPLMFRFSSTQTAQPNFSYIVETYYNSVKVSEDRIFVESGIYAHIDVSPIVKNLLNTPQQTIPLFTSSGTNGSIYIKVIENYGLIPINQANATSSTIKIFKACLSDADWKEWDATEWVVNKYLTNHPEFDPMYQQFGAPFYLSAIVDTSTSLSISFYDIDDVLIHSYYQVQTTVIAQINLSTDSLVANAGVPDIDAVHYYIVEIGSILKRVYIQKAHCNPIQSLSWINEYGAWDSFIFDHNLERKGGVTERMYGKKFGQWVGTNFVYNLNQAGNIRVGTQVTDSATLYTGWISQTLQNWLVELFKAPRFYLYTNKQISVRVTSSQYTYEQQRFEDLISQSVDVEYTNNHLGLSL